MANKKFTGELKKEISNAYSETLKKGESVIAHKRRIYDENSTWTGEWEYHYQNLSKTILIRCSEFLIETK